MFENQKVMTKIGTLFLAWRRLDQKKIATLGITLKQFRILQCLSSADFLYPSDLAEAIYADRPTVTVILNNLEKQGWITRQQNPENKKMIQIRITNDGLLKKEGVEIALFDKSKDFSATSCFTPKELEQFHYLLNKLYHHFKSYGLFNQKED